MSSRPSRGAARLASILDALPDALLLVDVNGTVVNANAIALETFESPGTALVGRGLLDLLPTFDSKRIPGSMRSPREAAEDTRTKPTRMTARRTDGTEFPVEITSANLEDGRTPYAEAYQDYGDPQQPHYTGDELLMLVVRDLSGTVDTEAELARQQRQTEMILRAAAEGVVGVDTAGKIVLVNPSAAQILGHRATDLGGKELHPLVHHSRPDGSPLAYEETPLADTLRSGRKHRVRGQVLWRKDGKPVPVDLTTAPVRDGDQLVGAVMTFTDRTAYDANDARSAQLRALLDTSLRGPLAELRGELSGLAADPAGQLWPEANQILHHLSAGYARITTLIDNVLAFQRLDRGEDKLNRAEVGLDQVIAAAVDGAIELIGPGRAQYAVHAPPIEASIDAERMAQALAHLIADVAGVDSAGNAIAYTGDSTIVVAAAQRGDVIRLDVRGPRAGGDPVHLPLARGIVERHGGVLQTHEVPGQGSAYVLEVPVGTAGGRGPGGSGRRAGSGSAGSSGSSGTGAGSDDTGGQPRESDTTVMPVPSQPVRGTQGPDDASAGTSTGLSSAGTGTGRAPHPRRAADDADGTIVAPWAVPAAAEPEAPTGRRRALRRPEEQQPDAGGQSEAGAPTPPPTGRRARRARPETPEDGPAGRPELPAAQTPHALPPASPAPQVPAQAQPQEGTGRRARRAIDTGPAPKQSAPASQPDDPGPGPWPGRTGPHPDAPAPRAPWQDPSSDATPPPEGPAPRPTPWPNAAREAEEEGGAQSESGPGNVTPQGPGSQWPNAENPPRAVEGGPQGRSRRRNVNPQGEPDSPWPNPAANQPGDAEDGSPQWPNAGNAPRAVEGGPQGRSRRRNVNPQGEPDSPWPNGAANAPGDAEGNGPQGGPELKNVNPQAGPGASWPNAGADQPRPDESDAPQAESGAATPWPGRPVASGDVQGGPGAPWQAREAEGNGPQAGPRPRNVNPQAGPGASWPNAGANQPHQAEGNAPQGGPGPKSVNPQGPGPQWPNARADQPHQAEGNGPQAGPGRKNVNPQAGPGASWPNAAANQPRPDESSGPQTGPDGRNVNPQAGPGAGSPPPWLAAADQARSPEGDVPAWPNAANRPGPAAEGNGPQGGASSWPHAGGPQPSAEGEHPAWRNGAEQPSGPASAAAASGWRGAGDQDEEQEQGRDEGHEQDEDPRRPGDDGNPAWPGPGEQGPEQPAPAAEEEPPAAAFGVVAPWPDPSERQAQPQRNRPGVPLPPSAWPAAQDPSQQSHGRAISVRTLGQGMPFGQHGGDPQTQTQAVQAQAPLPAQVAAGGSGRRRRLSAPPNQPPAQPPNPGQGQGEEQDQGPGGEPQARQHPQAEPDSGQLPVRRTAPEPPRPRLPGDHETALLRPVPAEPPNVPHQASGGRAYAIGAPAAGADEGPEPLDGPNGAVDVTDVASDRLDEGLDEPRRLLVWPEPDVSTRQALTDRGYRPVIVRSREEVDAQVAEPPAALFVDPLTGPITRTALQSLRQAAAAADVPVLVTAGLGQATREAAYGADPAVLLKALAPRDSEQHPPRVLLVESHEAIAQAFSATLERRGMQVTHANSETEAMTKAAQVHPNLVVMDLMLIRRRRQGIVDWLRGNARLTHTPMVVYTSADIDPSELPRLASGETVLFLAERSTSTDVQSRIVDLLSKIGS
ncbi:PAS domain-containing protein [Streptomyces sp. CA-111067]|uniref:PAS domain-containing protein n=1 Tax=Streptomyces sp. CA-111067 TaxID=3240046 RepID=UPI003D952FDB